jgi:tetratricopeptide (TPR) repeat protein
MAVNDMYDFEFDRAENRFLWLKKYYPSHPLPYFLMGFSNWWKIMPNLERPTPPYDQRFLSYTDTAIALAERLYKKNPKNVEASFFLSASHGLRGRFYGERSSWTKAISEGKKSLKYLELNRDEENFLPELLFGDGLYNYYSVYIPKNYPNLRPVLIFFKKGNLETGIKLLQRATLESFYSRFEAQHYLMKVYEGENEHLKAYELAKILHTRSPNNPYFHRSYIRALYMIGNYPELEKSATDLLEKVQAGKFGYEEISGRYAAFYLATCYRFKDRDKSKVMLLNTIQFAEKINAHDSGYNLYAHLELAKIYLEEDKPEYALPYLDKIIDKASRSHSTYPEAKVLQKKTKEEIKKRLKSQKKK